MSSSIEESLMNIFDTAAKEAKAEGYEYIVVFPRMDLYLSADNKLRVSAFVASNPDTTIDLTKISSDFRVGKVGFGVRQDSQREISSQNYRMTFVAFRNRDEQEALLQSLQRFDFFNKEKAYAEIYDAGIDANQNPAANIAYSSSKLTLQKFAL